MIIASLKLFFKKYDIIYVDEGTYLGRYHFMGTHFCHKRYLKYKMRFYDRIYETFNSWIERFEYKRKGIIIAVSETLKHELIEEFNVREDRIIVIYNGIDLKEYQKKEILPHSHSLTLLFIGDPSYRKGLDFLIEAMRGIDENIRLLVAGKLRKKYKKLAKGLNIEFLGFRKDIPQLFHKVDAFILPSIYEPFGIVVLEAMAIGIPIIMSSHAGVSELIKDMENGIILKDPTNINEIREKITLLKENIKLRRDLGIQAQLTAKNYTWERMAKKRINLIMK
jgi:glycosyltransferase involved in cell wall biosynthesis